MLMIVHGAMGAIVPPLCLEISALHSRLPQGIMSTSVVSEFVCMAWGAGQGGEVSVAWDWDQPIFKWGSIQVVRLANDRGFLHASAPSASAATEEALSTSACDLAARRARTASAAALRGGNIPGSAAAEAAEERLLSRADCSSAPDGSGEERRPVAFASPWLRGEPSAIRPPSSSSTSDKADLALSRAARRARRPSEKAERLV